MRSGIDAGCPAGSSAVTAGRGDRLDSRGQLDLLLLSTLSGGGAHGYAIIATIRRRSNGAFVLAEGTVYPALRRLEGLELVHGTWGVHQGRRRKVYSLTPLGAEVLATERGRWERFSATVDAVIGAT